MHGLQEEVDLNARSLENELGFDLGFFYYIEVISTLFDCCLCNKVAIE